MKISREYPFLKYLPLVLLFPVFLNFVLFSFDTGLSYGDGNVWLAFWGNYTGGLISALVAYFVANSQIQKQVSLDLEQRHFELATNQLPALIRLRIELDKILLELEEIKNEMDHIYKISLIDIEKASKDKTSIESLKFSSVIPDSILREIFFHKEVMDKEVYKYLEKVEDIDLQIELIDTFSFYEKFSRGLYHDFHISERRKDELSLEIVNSDFSNSALESQFFNIDMEERKAIKDRRDGYRALYDENKIEEIKKILHNLIEEIERSYRIKKDGTMGV